MKKHSKQYHSFLSIELIEHGVSDTLSHSQHVIWIGFLFMINIWVDCWHIAVWLIFINQFFLWNFYFFNVNLGTLFPFYFSRLGFDVFGRLPFFKFLFNFVDLWLFHHCILWFEVFLFLEDGLFAVLHFHILLCSFLVQFGSIHSGLVEKAFHAIFLIEFFLVWLLLLNLCHDLIYERWVRWHRKECFRILWWLCVWQAYFIVW